MNQQMAPWQGAIAQSERKFSEIAEAEGNLVNYQKEAMFAMQTIQGSEHLQNANADSIRNSVINVASIGLSLNPALAFAYLVPRDGKCCLDISYKGMVKIATDTGSIQWAKAELVYKGEPFQLNGYDSAPTHPFNPFDRGDISTVVGAYCVAKLHDGTFMVETMSREVLDKIRATSKANNAKAPWSMWPEEMMKKSVIKRAYKSWPKTSRRLAEAIHIVNENEGLSDEYLATKATEALQETVIQPLSDEEFNSNIAKWMMPISAGTQTIEKLKEFISSKGSYLTDEQIEQINNYGAQNGNN